MMIVPLLKAAGIDYDNGVSRFMGDKELYEEALALLSEQVSADEAEAALREGDYPRMFAAVHALKGAFGNMDVTGCYIRACNLTELLRREPYREDDIAREMNGLKSELDKVKRSIKDAMRQP